jgi:hypothetical protein
LKLPNTASKLQLITPSGHAISTVPWKSAEEGRVYLPDDIRSVTVRGRVLTVTGPTTFILDLEGEASSVLGTDTVNVSILGVLPNEDVSFPENFGPYEYIRALIENKNVELQFDTDIWDDLGRIMAYISTEEGRDVGGQLLMTQYFVQDRALNYAKKNEYSLINYAHSRTLDSAIQVDSLLSDYSGISNQLSLLYGISNTYKILLGMSIECLGSIWM